MFSEPPKFNEYHYSADRFQRVPIFSNLLLVSALLNGDVDRGGDMMIAALEHFHAVNGDDLFRNMFRQVFLDGEEWINMIAAWLEKMRNKGVAFVIMTAGTSTAVLRALIAVPEWQAFFPSSRIWDTQLGRHSFSSTTACKVMTLSPLWDIAWLSCCL